MARLRRTPPLTDRVAALGEAASLSAGRGDEDVVAEALRVVRQADRRLAFSGDATVVALAGATGSGKSSLFNALAGAQLAEPGLKRPTTATALAASFGPEPPQGLLDWLQIPRRQHLVNSDPRLAGLVLLDLPDHDSIEVSHRLEVDRLVAVVDGMIWVVDPQKYADNALHSRYLRPYRDYAEVMIIVLNQADRLSAGELAEALADLRRMLAAEGLGAASVLAVSARTGQGIDQLRTTLAQRVRGKKLAAERLSADVSRAAGALSTDLGPARSGADLPSVRVAAVTQALATAAGVDRVADAVLRATRRRGSLATGWPLISWLNRLRPDPLKRLHLDRVTAQVTGRVKEDQLEPVGVQRTSLAISGGVEQARLDTALRELGRQASEGLPSGWAEAVRRATTGHRAELPDALDAAIAGTDLGVDRPRGWWRVVKVLQWLLIAVVAAGLLWLSISALLAYLQFPALPSYRWHAIPLPTWAIIGGLSGGLLLGLIARLGVEISARRRAGAARRALQEAVQRVVAGQVIEPVSAELRRHARARELIDQV